MGGELRDSSSGAATLPRGREAVVAAGAAVVLLAAGAAATRGVGRWEVTTGRWPADLPSWSTPVLEVVMQAGTRGAPLVLALLLAGLARWRWRAVGVAAAGLAAWLVTQWIKALVDRPRPTAATLGRSPHEVLDGAGFPSTHTAIATALATIVVLLARPRRPVVVAAAAAATLTGAARLHLGLHWTLDVVGGVAVGLLVGTGVARLVGCPPAGPVHRAGGDDELVVATFNVRNGRALDGWHAWPLRSRATAATARQLGADVLAVQEAFRFQASFLASALPGYRLVGRGRGVRGGEWCAVYVRTDRLRVVEATTRWYGETPDRPGTRLPGASFPRIATSVLLADEATGATFTLVNTHLDERHTENRRRSVEQLLGWLDADQPRIVAGDLNATYRRDPTVLATARQGGLRDTLPPDGPGTAHDYRGGTDHLRLDYILVSRHWEVVRSEVVADQRRRGFPSDHWPVTAHLRWCPDDGR